MSSCVHLKIGGVHFTVTCDTPIDPEAHDPAYRPFLLQDSANHAPMPGDVDIRIHIQTGAVPAVGHLKKIFDTGHSWSMYRDGDTSYISLFPETHGQPLWLAEVNRDVTSATLYCSKNLVCNDKGTRIVYNPVCYPLDQILLMYILGRRHGVMLHASGIRLGDRAIVFPGRSGAGKSTISQLFASGQTGEPLSDDRIAIRKVDDTFRAFGTPWPGEAGLAANKNVPLAGIFFIGRGDADRITEITARQALERLLPVASIPWYDPETLSRILDTCDDLVSRVPAHTLYFRKHKEVADVVEQFIGV